MVAALLRNHKRILIGLNAVLVAAVVGCVFYAFMSVDINANKPAVIKKTKIVLQQEKPLRQMSKNYDAIYARPLRRPLVEIASAVTAAPDVPVERVSDLNVQLLGTIVESGHLYGIFKGADGIDKPVGIGKKIDRAEVVDITEKSATLKYNGKLIVLKKVEQEKLPSPLPGIPGNPDNIGAPVNPGNITPRASRRRSSMRRLQQ